MSVQGRTATVLTHGRPGETAAALKTLHRVAVELGWTLRFDPEEVEKHGLAEAEGLALNVPITDHVDLCIALGGDGTILRALRRYTGTKVPVFGVNYGEIGFLATIDPDHLGEGFARAFRGEFDVLTLSALELESRNGEHAAINDISFHRKAGQRVATLAYVVDGEEVGSVRCDGLVVATPAGSTGYNLANGGPVMAWGVQGYVVSFIAPHSLTARALVVAPDDVLEVHNRGHDPVEVFIDGRPWGELGPGERLAARYVRDAAHLAQLPGASFYHRIRERFGRLAS